MGVVEQCAEEVFERGHAVVRMPRGLAQAFARMVLAYEAVPEAARAAFTFPERDDGFLPFGTEYARDREHPDLCRRFNYWHANAHVHAAHAFVDAPLYLEAEGFETRISAFAEEVLQALARRFPAGTPLAVRRRSYLQLCDYLPALRDPARTYMQDPHEDGHLLTLVKSTADGLVLWVDGAFRPVRLAADEMVVFAGSMLTALTDGRIAPVTHAVVPPPPPGLRTSLMYFVNPEGDHGRSWLHRRPLDLAALSDQAQVRFGKPHLKTA